MSLETQFDSFERPKIGRAAVPAFNVTARADFYESKPARSQSAGHDRPLSERYQGGSQELGGRAHLDVVSRDLTFDEFLDVINPLQHIPGVAAVYRELTGDEISTAARSVGGFLFGGPIGLIGGAVNGVVQEATGSDVAQHVLAAFDEPDEVIATTAAVPPSQKPPELLVSSPPVLAHTKNETDRNIATVKEEPAPTQEAVTIAPTPISNDANTLTGASAVQAFLKDLQTIGVSRGENGGDATGQIVETSGAKPIAETPLTRDEKPLPTQTLPNGIEGVRPETTSANPQAIPPNATHGEGEAVASRMLEALNKYQTMLQRRNSQLKAGS